MVALSPQQLGQLIPFVPSLINWLRHCEPKKAGDLLISSSTVDKEDVQATLRELLNAINYNGDLTNIQLRYICSCHDAATWSSAVRLIFAESDPRVVPNEVGAALAAAYSRVGSADVEQFCQTIGAILDQLPRSHYESLGELCGMLRDTCDDPAQLSALIGPMIFNPRTGTVAAASSQAVVGLMQTLIAEAESVFGKPGAFITKDAFGVRKAAPTLTKVAKQPSGSSLGTSTSPGPAAPVSPPPGLDATKASGDPNADEASLKAKRMQQLRAFYLWRDPTRAEKVPILFANHCFEDIGKALMRKYGMLPPGWKGDLLELKAAGSTKLDWFTGNEGEKGKPGGGAGGPGTPVNQSAPPPIQGSRPQSLKQYFTGKKDSSAALPTSSSPVSAAASSSAGHDEDEAPRELTKVDKIVNEICDTEQNYHDSLAELIEAYVKTIRAISSGQKGPEAAEALGLSSAEVEQIFGWRLEEIVAVSNNLLSKLEVVTLVRSDPLTGEGRQGLVAEAFIEISNELHVYAPYVSAHRSSVQTLEKAIKKLSEKKNSRTTGLGAQLLQRNRDKGVVSEMTFTKLWEVVSSASPRLKGQSISSILIMPVQRIPRYNLLLQELKKGTKSGHPAFPMLEEAGKLISSLAGEINEALKKHEKLGKFFGAEDMLNPTSSALKKGENGGLGIQQKYVDGI